MTLVLSAERPSANTTAEAYAVLATSDFAGIKQIRNGPMATAALGGLSNFALYLNIRMVPDHEHTRDRAGLARGGGLGERRARRRSCEQPDLVVRDVRQRDVASRRRAGDAL